MAGLFTRIFRQWIEDALVKRLSENESFQKAAVGAVSAAQRAQELMESAAKDPSRAASTFAAVMQAVKAEAAKDMGVRRDAANGSSSSGFRDAVVDVTGGASSSADAGAHDGATSSSRRAAAPSDAFAALSSKELKAELTKRGLSSAGLLEKSELLAALRAAASKTDEMK
jgi:hypothetical protein